MKIESEQQAIEVMEAVVAWCVEAPDGHLDGEETGQSYRRGRVLASLAQDSTLGMSTYKTVEAATAQLTGLEAGYRNWRALATSKVTIIGGKITHVERRSDSPA